MTGFLVILSLVPRLILQSDVADVGIVFLWGHNETRRNKDRLRLAIARAGWFLRRSSSFHRTSFPKSRKTGEALLMQRSGLTCVTMALGSLRLLHRVLCKNKKNISIYNKEARGRQGSLRDEVFFLFCL